MANRRALVVAGGTAAGTLLALAIVLALVRPAADAPRAAVGNPLKPIALIPTAQRRPLPDVGGMTLLPPPDELRLRQLRGKPMYIDVWASWCPSCRQEAPMIARLARRWRSMVRFIGIDTQDRASAGRKFVREFELDFPHLFDPKTAVALRLGVYGVPTMFLVDRRGRTAAVLVGKQGERRLERALRLLVADRA